MAEFPTLPFFTDSYLSDTRHLSAAQHGAYFLLLMTAWRTQECALPNDDEKLAKWGCMDLRTWQRNKKTVMGFWRLGSDGLWRQGKLIEVRQYVESLNRQKSVAGKASSLKRLDNGQRALDFRCNGKSTIQTQTQTQIKKEEGYGGEALKALPPPSPSLEDSPSEYLGEENKQLIHPQKHVELSPVFNPDDEWAAYAGKLGFSVDEAIKELEKFIGYWTVGKGANRKKTTRGWRQAWSNWLSNAEKYRR